MIKVNFPISLRKYINNVSVVEIEQVETIHRLWQLLVLQYPQLKTKIFSENGQLHTFINAFVNGKNIRHLEGEKTILENNCEVTLIAAIAGG